MTDEELTRLEMSRAASVEAQYVTYAYEFYDTDRSDAEYYAAAANAVPALIADLRSARAQIQDLKSALENIMNITEDNCIIAISLNELGFRK